MTLEVIGTGFWMYKNDVPQNRLEELGFGPCYHMIEVFEHPEHLKR